MVYLNGFEEWLMDRLKSCQPNSIEEVIDKIVLCIMKYVLWFNPNT